MVQAPQILRTCQKRISRDHSRKVKPSRKSAVILLNYDLMCRGIERNWNFGQFHTQSLGRQRHLWVLNKTSTQLRFELNLTIWRTTLDVSVMDPAGATGLGFVAADQLLINLIFGAPLRLGQAPNGPEDEKCVLGGQVVTPDCSFCIATYNARQKRHAYETSHVNETSFRFLSCPPLEQFQSLTLQHNCFLPKESCQFSIVKSL